MMRKRRPDWWELSGKVFVLGTKALGFAGALVALAKSAGWL
jgi:hypothetical protein